MTRKEREIVQLLDQAIEVSKTNLRNNEWDPGDCYDMEWGRLDILYLMRQAIARNDLSSLAIRATPWIREDV
jgi:hypothetical protein